MTVVIEKINFGRVACSTGRQPQYADVDQSRHVAMASAFLDIFVFRVSPAGRTLIIRNFQEYCWVLNRLCSAVDRIASKNVSGSDSSKVDLYMQPVEDLEALVGDTIEMKFLEVNEEEERCVFSARSAQAAGLTAGFKASFALRLNSTHISPFRKREGGGGGGGNTAAVYKYRVGFDQLQLALVTASLFARIPATTGSKEPMACSHLVQALAASYCIPQPVPPFLCDHIHAAFQQHTKRVFGCQVGDVVVGTVQSVKPYGAFVDMGSGVNGLLHISQISEDRVSNVEDVLSEGDKLKVPCRLYHLQLEPFARYSTDNSGFCLPSFRSSSKLFIAALPVTCCGLI